MPILKKVHFCSYLVRFGLPSDADDDGDGDGDDASLIFLSGQTPRPLRTGIKYPVRGIPHFDFLETVVLKDWRLAG